MAFSRDLKLKAENMWKSYRGRVVLQGVSFEVECGKVKGLLGPNGAGKTTSFYAVVGLITPDRGRVLLGEEDICLLPVHARARKGIAYLPQEVSVFRKLTVEENILMVLEQWWSSPKERYQRLEQLLEEFHLTSLRYQKAYTLSGGERRRVEIARALAMDPLFLLLDEPFAGLDPIAVEEIQKMLLLLKKKGLGILVTDHNVRETLKICDYSYLLADGKILVEGTPFDLAQSEKARRFYLGEHFDLPLSQGGIVSHGHGTEDSA